MTTRPTRRERCAMGKHTPIAPEATRDHAVRHDVCRYCGRPIMRTAATRIWFEAGVMAEPARVAVALAG
jgi:hypothetical protein